MNLYGELIRKLRQDNNITQEELANILLITPEKMAQVEAGQELLTDSDLIVEAVLEKMEIKKDLFKTLDEICKEDCIF